jgi:hypothetical protein
LVIPPGEHAIARGEPGRETEYLHFLGRLVARPHEPQVVELAPLGRAAKEERVAERRIVCLAEEARKHGRDKEQEKPRTVRDEHNGERGQRNGVLRHTEELREQRDPAGGLLARPLEVVVRRGVLELGEVQGRRVDHESDAHEIGKEVAEQRFDQRGRTGEELTSENDRYFQGDVAPQAANAGSAGSADDGVDDELSDPERGYRDHAAYKADCDHGGRQGVVCLPDEAKELHQCPQHTELLAPTGGLCAGGGEQHRA